MYVGLPESTRIDEINTAKQIIKLKPKMVTINPVFVIKGTILEKKYINGEYKSLTITQAVEICKELVELFAKHKIMVGLEEFSDKKLILAGPYHNEFKLLVESAIWKDVIVNKIKKLNTKVKEVVINVNPIDVNSVIGYKKENIINLKELYDVDLIVKADEKMKKGKSKIKITKIYGDFSKI